MSNCIAQTIQFGLKESSLIHQQAYIDGKWVDANEGAVIRVTSALRFPSVIVPHLDLSLRLLPRPGDDRGARHSAGDGAGGDEAGHRRRFQSFQDMEQDYSQGLLLPRSLGFRILSGWVV